VLDCVWNVMAHAQEADFVLRRNGRVHLNRRGASVQSECWQPRCAPSAVVMLDTLCSEVVWRVLAAHSIRQFPLHFPLPCVTVCHHISTGLYHQITPHLHQIPFALVERATFIFGSFYASYLGSLRSLKGPNHLRHPGPPPQKNTQLQDKKAEVLFISGARGSELDEALWYKPKGRGLDSRWCHCNFLLTQTLTEMSTGNVSWY